MGAHPSDLLPPDTQASGGKGRSHKTAPLVVLSRAAIASVLLGGRVVHAEIADGCKAGISSSSLYSSNSPRRTDPHCPIGGLKGGQQNLEFNARSFWRN